MGSEADIGGGVPVEALFWLGGEHWDDATNKVVVEGEWEGRR